MSFGIKNAQNLSQETFVEEKKDVEKDALEK
jgi:hypothetical protein